MAISNDFIGTWSLISFDGIPTSDSSKRFAMMGENPQGRIFYHEDGYMSAIIYQFNSFDKSTDVNGHLENKSRSFISYSAKYNFQKSELNQFSSNQIIKIYLRTNLLNDDNIIELNVPITHSVYHQVESSIDKTMLNTTLSRHAAIFTHENQTYLMLRPQEGYDINGDETFFTLIWKKI